MGGGYTLGIQRLEDIYCRVPDGEGREGQGGRVLGVFVWDRDYGYLSNCRELAVDCGLHGYAQLDFGVFSTSPWFTFTVLRILV